MSDSTGEKGKTKPHQMWLDPFLQLPFPFWVSLSFLCLASNYFNKQADNIQDVECSADLSRWQLRRGTGRRRTEQGLQRCQRRGSIRRKYFTSGANYLIVHWNWRLGGWHLWQLWATSPCTLRKSRRPAPWTLPKLWPAFPPLRTPIPASRFCSFFVFAHLLSHPFPPLLPPYAWPFMHSRTVHHKLPMPPFHFVSLCLFLLFCSLWTHHK